MVATENLLEDHAYLSGADRLQKMRLIRTHYLYYHMGSNEKEEARSTESAATWGTSCSSSLRSQQGAMLT